MFVKSTRKTYPCNLFPLKPHFYIEKLGFAGIHLIFLFLIQNIHSGYSLEPPLTCTQNACFELKYKKNQNFVMKISIFITLKKCVYVHGNALVM